MSEHIPYTHTGEIHNMKAPRAVVPLIMEQVAPRSVLDVGCGTGTWLKAFEECGVTDYLGVDGDHLKRELLEIKEERFLEKDLQQEFNLQRTFDLVVSLEVAEHLNEAYADNFVKSLVNHGNTILFSAAIPGQGGQHHVNEQWPEYWIKKFELHGYFFHDTIRPLIWNNDAVDWWYRQNIFIVSKNNNHSERGIQPMIHPELYNLQRRIHQQYVDSLLSGKQGLKVSTTVFIKALLFKIKSLFGK